MIVPATTKSATTESFTHKNVNQAFLQFFKIQTTSKIQLQDKNLKYAPRQHSEFYLQPEANYAFCILSLAETLQFENILV